MSERGGTYRSPQGQQLYGDGREVDPVTRPTKKMTRLERIAANYKSLAEEYPEAAPIRAMLSGPMADLLAVAEAAQTYRCHYCGRASEEPATKPCISDYCNRLRASLAPLLEKVKSPELDALLRSEGHEVTRIHREPK